MKFLCVACDEPMQLMETVPPDEGGSLTVLYACPSCRQQTAMLTNSHETQLVQSLGVKIGPGQAAAAGDSGMAAEAAAGGCPFSGMLAEMEAKAAATSGPTWTPEALERLENIPEFVRPMAKQGVESYAKGAGHNTIDLAILDEARDRFGM